MEEYNDFENENKYFFNKNRALQGSVDQLGI